METYQIKASSWVIYILTLLVIIFVGIALAMTLLPTKNNFSVAAVVAVVVFGCAFYATRFTSVAKTEWIITESEIQLKWHSQFLFQHEPNLNIDWGSIKEYKYQPDQNFDLFKLKLKNGTVVKLWHNSSTTKDDFKRFVTAFEKQVQVYNHKPLTDQQTFNKEKQSNSIKRGKTIYETKFGLAFAIFAGLCLVAIPILITFVPSKSKISWTGLGAAYTGGLFFIFQVLAYRKKKKQQLGTL